MLSKCPICDTELVAIYDKDHIVGYFCDECGSYFDERQKECKVII